MGRSWTDLASNVTHIEGVLLDNNLEQLLRPGAAPVELILRSLHEFTHHWCFFSSLGMAATGLRCRLARTVLAGDPERRNRDVFRDYVVQQTLNSALRPLDEGMALFAEFDVMSLRGRTLSTPLRSAISFFSGKAPSLFRPGPDNELVPSSTPGDDLLAISLPVLTTLRTMRAGDAGVRRKVNVLATPLREDRDGYLTGYLAVRGIARALRERVSRLYQETDLALSFIRSFFYEDMRLVEYVLESDDSPTQLSNAIVKRLYRRTAEISDVTAEDIQSFEEHVLAGLPADDPAWAAPLHLSMQEWNRGRAAYHRLADLITNEAPLSGTGEAPDARLARHISEAYTLMLRRRHIVHLGKLAAEVRVGADGEYEVRVNGRAVFTGTATNSAPAQHGPGSLELIFSALSAGVHRGIVVFGPQTPVDVVIPDSAHLPGDRELLMDAVLPRDQYLRLADGTQALIDSYVNEAGMPTLLEHLTANLAQAVTYLWLDIGLNHVDDHRLESVIAVLEEGGVYGLLGYDWDLLHALSVLGPLAPTMPLHGMLQKELERHEFTNPENVVRALAAREEITGFTVLASDGVLALVHV